MSEKSQVFCVWHSVPKPLRRLGRESAPFRQRGRTSLLVNFTGDQMTLLIEMVVDLGVN